MLDEAQRQLTTDPERALALTDVHSHEHPNGSLAEEREVIAIDALMRVGRSDEAETRAQAFFAAHGGSGHARRIRRIIDTRE